MDLNFDVSVFVCLFVYIAVTLLDTTTSESLNWVTFSTGDGTTRRGVSIEAIVIINRLFDDNNNDYNNNNNTIVFVASFVVQNA